MCVAEKFLTVPRKRGALLIIAEMAHQFPLNYTPQLVRESCSLFHSPLAWIDLNAVQEFVDSVDLNEIFSFSCAGASSSTNNFTTEISFPSLYDEAGFIFLAHAIDFGSGYRPYLHKYRHGQGAWLTIREGLIKLGNQNPVCDAIWLSNLTESDIVNLFDLSYPELLPLARFIHEDLQEIGLQLLLNGYSSPGHFLQINLPHLQATSLVNLLVTLFPLTFRDEYHLPDPSPAPSESNTTPTPTQRVCFYKKAQLVVSELSLRFSADGATLNATLPFPDIDRLTGFVDNVVVAMLRRYGMIQCSEELCEIISSAAEGNASVSESEGSEERMPRAILKGSEEEIALRACGVHAIELLVEGLNTSGKSTQKVNSQLVCNWLWGSVGKAGENRSYPRHLTPSTSFY
jgi:hypothetical protein